MASTPSASSASIAGANNQQPAAMPPAIVEKTDNGGLERNKCSANSKTTKNNNEIHRMDEGTIRRMVSGQAVTDLASAVKELVDNAIDAGAVNIHIRFFEEGREVFEVSDDGCGVPVQSRPLMAKPHSTSKIRSVEDIYRDNSSSSRDNDGGKDTTTTNDTNAVIGRTASMGFRGEALSSLACLSHQLICMTRTAGEEMAQKFTFLRNGNLDFTSVQLTPRKVGTTVAVVRFLDAVPVRRHELLQTFSHQRAKCLKMLEGYAILRTGIRFHVMDMVGRKGRESTLLATCAPTGQTLQQNISSVLGSKFLATLGPLQLTVELPPIEQQQALEPLVNREQPQSKEQPEPQQEQQQRQLLECRITGFVTKANASPTTTGSSSSSNAMACVRQGCHYYSINGRPVDVPKVSRLLHQLWKRVACGSTPHGAGHKKQRTRPSCVLQFDLPNHCYDINLDPNKRSVLFTHEDAILDAVSNAVTELWSSQLDGQFQIQKNAKLQPKGRTTSASASATAASAALNSSSAPGGGGGGGGYASPSDDIKTSNDPKEKNDNDGEGNNAEDDDGSTSSSSSNLSDYAEEALLDSPSRFTRRYAFSHDFDKARLQHEFDDGRRMSKTKRRRQARMSFLPSLSNNSNNDGGDGAGNAPETQEGQQRQQEQQPPALLQLRLQPQIVTAPGAIGDVGAARDEEGEDPTFSPRQLHGKRRARISLLQSPFRGDGKQDGVPVPAPPPMENALGGGDKSKTPCVGSPNNKSSVTPSPNTDDVAATTGTAHLAKLKEHPDPQDEPSRRPNEPRPRRVSSMDHAAPTLQQLQQWRSVQQAFSPSTSGGLDEQQAEDPLSGQQQEQSQPKKLFGLERFGFCPVERRNTESLSCQRPASTAQRAVSTSACSTGGVGGTAQIKPSSTSEASETKMAVETETERQETATSRRSSSSSSGSRSGSRTPPPPPPPPVVWDAFSGGTEQVVLQSRRQRLAIASAERKRRLQQEQAANRSRRTAAKRARSGSNNDYSAGEDVAGAIRLTKEDFSNMVVIGQFNMGFILAKSRDNHIWILDQHACDEKYNFEKLCRETVFREQALIAPMPLELSAAEETCVLDHLDLFEKNGFRFRYDPDRPPRHRLALTSLPHSGARDGRKAVQFGKEDVSALCAILGADADGTAASGDGALSGAAGTGTDGSGLYGNNAVRRHAGTSTAAAASGGTGAGGDTADRIIARLPKAVAMFASRACRTSIMIGKALSAQEMERVVRRLGAVEQPWNCPHGRPTLRHVGNVRNLILDDEQQEQDEHQQAMHVSGSRNNNGQVVVATAAMSGPPAAVQTL